MSPDDEIGRLFDFEAKVYDLLEDAQRQGLDVRLEPFDVEGGRRGLGVFFYRAGRRSYQLGWDYLDGSDDGFSTACSALRASLRERIRGSEPPTRRSR